MPRRPARTTPAAPAARAAPAAPAAGEILPRSASTSTTDARRTARDERLEPVEHPREPELERALWIVRAVGLTRDGPHARSHRIGREVDRLQEGLDPRPPLGVAHAGDFFHPPLARRAAGGAMDVVVDEGDD